MTKKELGDYRSIVREIEEMEIELSAKSKQSIVSGSSDEHPYTKRTFVVKGLTHSADNSNALRHLRLLKARKKDIEVFINAIPDRITRRIFCLRYIYGNKKISWYVVANRMGRGYTADGVRMIVYRHLKNNC